jgi:hypothetical protein
MFSWWPSLFMFSCWPSLFMLSFYNQKHVLWCKLRFK